MGAVPFKATRKLMEVGGWTGLVDPRPLDTLSLALFSDAWFPPSFIALSEPAKAPTIDLTVHFREPSRISHDPEELCLAVFRTRLLREGFFEEDGVIWANDGTVLAQSRQMGIVLPI
jgi:acyl-CoA thioesterase